MGPGREKLALYKNNRNKIKWMNGMEVGRAKQDGYIEMGARTEWDGRGQERINLRVSVQKKWASEICIIIIKNKNN